MVNVLIDRPAVGMEQVDHLDTSIAIHYGGRPRAQRRYRQPPVGSYGRHFSVVDPHFPERQQSTTEGPQDAVPLQDLGGNRDLAGGCARLTDASAPDLLIEQQFDRRLRRRVSLVDGGSPVGAVK